MRKTFRILSYAVIMLLVSSCSLGDADVSSEAVITSFSMGNFSVRYWDRNIHGNDTLVSVAVTGSTIEFEIDQQNNLIYNPDSIPAGSDVDSVKTTIYSCGTVLFRKTRKDGTYIDTLWTDASLMDLREPVVLTVVSDDDSYTRRYLLKTNIHTIDPDSMTWKRMSPLPVTFSMMKAITDADSIKVFGADEAGKISVTVLNTRQAGAGWSTPTPCTGLDRDVELSSLTLQDGRFTVLDGSVVMSSTDGISWNAIGQDTPLKALVPFTQTGNGGQAWAITEDGRLAESSDMTVWTGVQELSPTFPDTNLTGLCYPLVTNAGIRRYIIAGTVSSSNTTAIWTRLSNEERWTEIETAEGHSLKCPSFSDMSVILYDGSLFAFGGNAEIDGVSAGPLSVFYQSMDNGITWRSCNAFYDTFNTWNPYMQFPDGLADCGDPFCHAVDSHECIWIITSGDCGVWRGFINRLYIP